MKLKGTWSERQQVLAVILVAGAAIVVLWYFLLSPLNLKRRRLESDIKQMQGQLAAKNYLLGEEALEEQKREEEQQYGRLRKEWVDMARRLSSGPVRDGAVGEADPLKIEYKVALFEVRRRLMQKSARAGISLPRDLHIDDTVDSNEEARQLMYQLRTFERLVDLFLDLKISALRDVQPLPLRRHRLVEGADPPLEEYSIRIEFYGSLQNLYDLLFAILKEENMFILREAKVQVTSPDRPGLLRMGAVLSALVFLEDPDKLVAPVQARQVFTRPLGH